MKSEIRFNKDMLVVLGGREHRLFKKFLQWCCDAFVVVRRHAVELECMLRAMRSANIEHLGVGRQVEHAVAKVRKNLCLWLDDEGARKYMEKLVRTCLASRGQDRLETMHSVAMVFKK